MTHCLDSWAILAWAAGEEPARRIVREAIDEGRPVMSWINLVEVHYRVARNHGEEEADRTLAELRGLVREDLPGVEMMRAVARLKAAHPIALADCFAVATAAASDASLITGDPEIVDRAADLPCEVVDARG